MQEDGKRWIMSVTLLVNLNRPIPLSEIEEVVSSALGELLNLDRNPDIKASIDESDRGGTPSENVLTATSNRVLCFVPGHDEIATVTPMTVPVQTATADGSYAFSEQACLSVAWHFKKSPLCWALVGAVALGIARSQGSEIEDNSGFFTIANVQSPEEFCQMLRVPTGQTDLESAAEALYSKMPKSAEVTAWLERQSR